MVHGTTLIVEGVHLDPIFNFRMMVKYGSHCLCYVIRLKHIKTVIR